MAAVPHELTPYVNLWLEVHRVQLIAQAGHLTQGVQLIAQAGHLTQGVQLIAQAGHLTQGVQLIARARGQVSSAGNHLWIDRWGNPMSIKAIQRQIWLRTRQAFGRGSAPPHLFRDCAVTELVDCAPEDIGIAPDLLGHADLRTARKHYIQAQGMTAHVRVQEVIVARRRSAASKGSSGA